MTNHIRLAVIITEALEVAFLNVAVLGTSARPARLLVLLVVAVQVVQRIVERVRFGGVALDDLQDSTSLRVSDNPDLRQALLQARLLVADNAQSILILALSGLPGLAGFQLLIAICFALGATGVLVEFRCQTQALVVLCDGLRLVPVGGYDGVVEDSLLRLGLLAHAGGAGAVLLLLEYTAHGCL